MGITLEILEGPEYRRDENGWEHNWYRVQLRRDGSRMNSPWMQGMANVGPPRAEDVLASLLMDASGYENALDYEDWCAQYGMEPSNSRKTYRQVETLTARVKRFLGDDYDATSDEDAEDAAKRLVSA